MLITKNNIIQELLTDDLIVQSFVYSDKSAKYWKIQKPLGIQLSNGVVINILSGFTYDMSTVPKWLWSVVRPFNDGLFGYLVHDALYLDRSHGMTRKECDDEMLFWTTLTNKNKFDNKLRWVIVRLLGWAWWNKII
jgi:hypothetical protein